MELKGDISSRKNDNPGDVAPEFRPLTLEEWLPLGPVGRKAAAELVNDSETQVVIVRYPRCTFSNWTPSFRL